MITDIRYDGFIGIFDTEYDTQPLIDYWEYQNNVGAPLNVKVYLVENVKHMLVKIHVLLLKTLCWITTAVISG